MESIDVKLSSMNLGGKKGSFMSRRKLKEPPRNFKRFIKEHMTAKTKNRIRTFEKFSFTTLEKMSKGLKDQISNISMNEPKSSLNIVDFWKEEDVHMMMHFGSYINDKKKLQ